MFDISLIDWWRILHAVFGLIVLVLMILDLAPRIHHLSDARKYWAISLLGFITATIVTSLESLYFNDRVSIRTPLNTACLIWCALALRAVHRDSKKFDASILEEDD